MTSRPIPPKAFLRAMAALPVLVMLTAAQAALSAVPGMFQPLSVMLQPGAPKSVLPIWEIGNPLVQPESDDVLLPVPPLAAQDEIGCFALTVVFQDDGDGGPVVEWQPKEGDKILLSAGLGQTGIPVGLNARTLLITQSIALDGGTLRISYAGRFSRLISVTLRPARELSVASLGAEFNPSLLGANEAVLNEEEVSGSDETPKGGDSTEGQVIHAELSAPPKQLDSVGSDGGTEFIIPMALPPQGSLIQTEIAGLDPESRIEVTVNGEALGDLAPVPFSLNAPSTLLAASGRLQIAGWHPTSLFIPARLWKEGDNSIVLSLQRSAADEGKPVYLRKARVDLLFSPISSKPTPLQNHPAVANSAPADTLSTGSAYGNPSPTLFHAAPAPLSLK